MKQEVIQKAEEKPKQQGPNLTGIPTQMKLDFEQRSGLSFDDVRVHYNSDKPARIGALAYTQGTQVHVGPGQERHLRHELGHVVQQKRGIVASYFQIDDTKINTDPLLEKGADSPFQGRWSTANVYHAYVQPIVQAKIKVGIDLRHIQDTEKRNCNEYLINNITLAQRDSTGLVNPETGKATQGDHTISDAFIKEYQILLLRNRPLSMLYAFYEKLFNEVKQENWHIYQRICSIPNNDITREKRRMRAMHKYVECGELYLRNKQTEMSIDEHIFSAKSIIENYNAAYAHSLLSVYGKGSGNKGEQVSMKALKEWWIPNREFSYELLSNLIDVDATVCVMGGEGINILVNKLLSMLNELNNPNPWILKDEGATENMLTYRSMSSYGEYDKGIIDTILIKKMSTGELEKILNFANLALNSGDGGEYYCKNMINSLVCLREFIKPFDINEINLLETSVSQFISNFYQGNEQGCQWALSSLSTNIDHLINSLNSENNFKTNEALIELREKKNEKAQFQYQAIAGVIKNLIKNHNLSVSECVNKNDFFDMIANIIKNMEPFTGKSIDQCKAAIVRSKKRIKKKCGLIIKLNDDDTCKLDLVKSGDTVPPSTSNSNS